MFYFSALSSFWRAAGSPVPDPRPPASAGRNCARAFLKKTARQWGVCGRAFWMGCGFGAGVECGGDGGTSHPKRTPANTPLPRCLFQKCSRAILACAGWGPWVGNWATSCYLFAPPLVLKCIECLTV